jgi:membrane protease YdiL (CAAX protease family)
MLTDHLDAGPLSESIPEDLVLGRGSEVWFSSLDAIIWAPLVEEVAFRGFLYTTLRRRFPMVTATVLSSTIFALVHGYSLAGFVTIWWSGLVWACAYEKSRTLWPGILCHATSNALATLSPLLLYRW